MPSETFFCNDEVGERLSIGWAGRGKSIDPGVTLTLDTKRDRLPDGSGGEWWNASNWDLDRAAINRLIRALRRARDQAYGRDE